MYALVFVIEAVIRTALGRPIKKIQHFVLIKTRCAYILSVFIVVVVEFTALAILRT